MLSKSGAVFLLIHFFKLWQTHFCMSAKLFCIISVDPMTEGMLKMMGVFSELERNMISQRVKSGLQNAKAKGKQLG